MHLYYYHENVLLIKTMKHSTKCCFLELQVTVPFTVEMLVEVDRMLVVVITIHATVVPATNDHLRFGAKVAPRFRWPPDTGTLTRQRQ